MSTSLKEQLKRLSVPQTSALIDRTRRASILFDAKEAAAKDRRTIYELGISGLQELISLNAEFRQFELTLFDEATLNLVRSVEQTDVNTLLDGNISKFLQHLSPYFLLRPAHLCIEWLLRRFEVHIYNRDDLLALALPYHETNIFVRVLQVVRIRTVDGDWTWLRALQKPGLSLPKSVIIIRAAGHAGFLSFIVRTTVSILREFGSRAHLLQTQINFYTTVVIGALEITTDFKEWHISTLLESLLYALNAKVVDVTAAGYMIAAQLIARTQLKTKLCSALLDRAIAVSFEELRPAAVMLLVLIFDVQESAPTHFSEKAINTILGQKWLIPVIAALVKQNIEVCSLHIALLRDSVTAIQKRHEDEEIFKRLALQLLNDVDLPKSTACRIISCFLDCFVYEAPKTAPKLQDGDVIELDSDEDEEMSTPQTAFTNWYSDYLRRLEQKYPDAFDITIKEALSSRAKESNNRQMALKIAVGYRLKISNENATDIYESLYHHNAQLRHLAMQTLLKNLSNYQTRFQNLELLKACLADRLKDDSRLVVGELLKLPTKDFIEILGAEQFAVGLLSILYKIHSLTEGWSKLTPLVVKHLTSSQLLAGFDANLILLALMPLLFPSDHYSMSTASIEEILKSDLVKKYPFLKQLQTTTPLNPSAARARFLSLFVDKNNAKGLPTPKQLFKSIETRGAEYFKQSSQLTNFLVLMTVSLREQQTAAETLRMFEYIETFTKQFQIKQMNNLEKAQWEQVLSLQLYTDFLLSLVRYTNFNKLQTWKSSITTDSNEMICFLRVFELISGNTFATTKAAETEIWSTTLKQFIDVVFPETQMKVDFLTNFYVDTDVTCVKHCTATERLIAFKVLNSVLRRKAGDYELSLIHMLKIGNAFVSQHARIRTVALETLDVISNKCTTLNDNLKYLVQSILEYSYEISMDKVQYPLMLYLVLNSPNKRTDKPKSTKILHEILEFFNKSADSACDITFKAQLLDVFQHFNDEKTVSALIPLALEALKHVVAEQKTAPALLPAPYSNILLSIIRRFQANTIENILQECSAAWELFEKIFELYNAYMSVDGRELQPLPCALLNVFDARLYESFSSTERFKFIKLILRTEALAQNDTISLAAHKLLKHCQIDCKPLVSVLQQMYTDEAASNKTLKGKQDKRASTAATKPQAQTNALAWKEGVALLELLEHKEKLLHAEQLIPALFELLKYCLELEENADVEYTKQLILSTLLHCCRFAEANKLNLQKAFPKTIFRIDRIVQCVRATQNPQTHQNALTLLAHCAAEFPQQVLHNVVDIFTFMGSSVVRHDDAFSFHIIDNIIVSIIPILVQADKKSGAQAHAVIPVLKVFSDIMLDVPEHRRISLYTKLLNTLGAESHFWRFLCIIFEAQVVDEEKRRLLQRKTTPGATATTTSTDSVDKQAKRLEFIMALSSSFSPKIVLETCTQLLSYLKNSLPLSKEIENAFDAEMSEATAKSKRKSISSKSQGNEAELFDVGQHSEKQLRHFKYSIMQYLSSVSKAPELLRKIAQLSDAELLDMKPYFQNFIISILAYVPTANAAVERFEEPLQVKFWKFILHHLHDVLDNAISLLSPDMFLVVIIGLMQHQMLSVRKKVIELLITKMQSHEEDDVSCLVSCDEKRFHDLIKPLCDIIDGIQNKPEDETPPASPSSSPSNDIIFLQQTALIAVKLLSRHFALKYIAEFKEILANLTAIVRNRSNISKIVLASVVLALIEISSNLKAHSLEKLPKFMPQLIELLQQQAESVRQQPPDHVCVAIVTGFQKLFESLPRFLGPYIVDIITALSSISTRIAKQQQNKKDQRSTAALNKISTIWTRIASQVYVRILVPSCEKSYMNMMSSECYDEVEDLMKLLRESIVCASNEDLAPVQTELRTFFLKTLVFRYEMKQKQCLEQSRVAAIESTIIEAFVAYVLKLSESAFRPLYENVYDWAIKRIAQPETQLTYFLLSSRIGESLKSLFVLFAGAFLEDAAKLLEACNTAKTAIDADSETIIVELLKAILSTLHNVFLYASKNFINVHRFEMLMPKIVDQLENRFALEAESVQSLLTECIAQLAVVVSSDVMWKQLNYQVLLKTRTNVPEVRILSFNCCVEIARKLGDEFTSLLPETVPFIAELFEDENSRVEKNTRKSVQELESILGETLQKYL